MKRKEAQFWQHPPEEPVYVWYSKADREYAERVRANLNIKENRNMTVKELKGQLASWIGSEDAQVICIKDQKNGPGKSYEVIQVDPKQYQRWTKDEEDVCFIDLKKDHKLP